ncbi:MAG: hypothetical protein P8M22_02950 [Phycisphaerales bacterium]|nr:hypothetical protein [Phycisphaerales bacterium]
MKTMLALILTSSLIMLQACSDAPTQTDDGGIQTRATRGPVEVTVTATPRELEVGQPLTLVVETIAREGVTISMPMVSANANGSIGAFHVLSDEARPNIPLPEGEDGRSWTQVLVLDTFQAGPTELPELAIAFQDTRSDLPVEGNVQIDALPIEIISLIGDMQADTALRDISGPVEMIDPWPAWVWAAIVFGGLVVVGVITLLVRGRGLQELATLSPEEQARRDLASLESSGLLEQKQVQPFYFRLTDILRHYIEGRFGLQAPRATTAEFLLEMGHSTILNTTQQNTLGQFLRAADMVKFARHEPSAETGLEALSQARLFVEETASPEQEGVPAND